MGSQARATYEASVADVERLMELHAQIGGEDPGRRVGLEVLNKSAIVLMCAIWEACVEDLVTEVVEHYITELKNPKKLPKQLREQVAKELIDESDRAAILEARWGRLEGDPHSADGRLRGGSEQGTEYTEGDLRGRVLP